MNTNVKKCIFIMLIVFGLIWCLPQITFAGYQNLNELDFQIDVHENGDMRITEFWNVDLEDTNTLFKTFTKEDKYDGISDVVITEIKESEEINFKKSNEYNYHVDENYYQALDNPDGKFEIAWGVNSSYDEERKFRISYTVKNLVPVYNDCAEIYWKLIGEDFEIFCDEITGVINLPEGIENTEELRVWAHGPLNGTINKDANNKVVFQVEKLPTNTFLEVRVVTPTEIFSKSEKIVEENKLATILDEEAIFAKEANLAREEYARKQEQYKKIATVVLSIGIVVGSITFVVMLRKILFEKTIKPEMKLDYFRDIPNEEVTPAEAGYIYYKSEATMYNVFGKLFSATLLNLSLKGWITFGKKIDKKEEITITLNEFGKQELKDDEQEIYDFMKSLFDIGITFSMKEFEKAAKKKIDKFSKLGKKVIDYSMEINEKNGLYNKKEHNKSGIFAMVLVLYIVAAISSLTALDYNMNFMGTFIIIAIINVIVSIPLICRYNGFTQKGVDEAEKWNGLVKFMKDFSLIDKREVPELALWEKYLVYATAFGIADKVIKQLKVYFPEMADDEYLSSHYTYMHFIGNNDLNFVGNLSSSIGSVTNYASASGSGGGFSSGGGGGAGGGGGGGR